MKITSFKVKEKSRIKSFKFSRDYKYFALCYDYTIEVVNYEDFNQRICYDLENDLCPDSDWRLFTIQFASERFSRSAPHLCIHLFHEKMMIIIKL